MIQANIAIVLARQPILKNVIGVLYCLSSIAQLSVCTGGQMLRLLVFVSVMLMFAQNAEADDKALMRQCIIYKQAVEELNRNPPTAQPGQNIISSDIDCVSRIFNFNWHLERGRVATEIEGHEFVSYLTGSLCRDGKGWKQALADGWVITAQAVTFAGNKSLIDTIRSCP